MSTFLADGRWSVREAMRRFLRQNHIFHSDDELEAFLGAHRLLLRKRVPATTSRLLNSAPLSRRRLVHEERHSEDEDDDDDDDDDDDEADDTGRVQLDQGSTWVDYTRLVSAYAIHDNVPLPALVTVTMDCVVHLT
jgi:hypothetical protein